MSAPPSADPFATGGGGTLFEYKAAAWFASEIFTGRESTLGGRITAITLQTRNVLGFDDFRLEREVGNEVSTVDVQARHRQPFTARNERFADLLQAARTEVAQDPDGFSRGLRRLLLVVGARSPGHQSLHDLCATARASRSPQHFARAMARAPAAVRGRLEHVHDALGQSSAAELRRVLSVLDVVALDLDDVRSDHVVRAGNELSELWVPPNPKEGRDLFVRLFWELTFRGPRGEAVDERSLRLLLGEGMPRSPLAASRRGRLQGLVDAARGRVKGRLVALGVSQAHAEVVADYALAIPPIATDDPITVVTGEIGAGKSTELERLLHVAVARALDDPSSPIPARVDASELRGRPLRDVLIDGTSGLGDPLACGVVALVDGLDEAGFSVESLVPGAFAVIGEWPRSRVVLGTRDAPGQPTLPVQRMKGLTDHSVGELSSLLGADPHVVAWARPEVAETLRRPLFAILHALHSPSGQAAHASPAELVGKLAEHAVQEVARDHPDLVDVLTRVAARLVDRGGSADPKSVGLSVVEIEELRRSRLVDLSGGRIRFQLAVLGEWFAARHLLASREEVSAISADPGRAARWRYVLAQAVAQSGDDDVEDLLECLIRAGAGALAAWVLQECFAAFGPTEDPAEPLTQDKGAAQIRRALVAVAAAAWPASRSLRGIDESGKPTVGACVDGSWVTLAIPSRGEEDIRRATGSLFPPLAAEFVAPMRPGVIWLPYRSTRRLDSPAWAWKVAVEECSGELQHLVTSGRIASTIPCFREELAWRFANAMLGRDPTLKRESIPVAELVAQVEHFSSEFPDSVEVGVDVGYRSWRLTEARRFVRNIGQWGVIEISSPWPAADSKGAWLSRWWTAPQLLARLNAVGPAALDGYKEIVDRWLPRFAPYLSTYALMPLTLVGFVWVPTGVDSMDSQPGFVWYLEPADGTKNAARWELVDGPDAVADRIDLDELRTKLEHRRPSGRAFGVHHGDVEIFAPTPASRLARVLLYADLTELKWCSGSLGASVDDPLVVPEA
jgi:hypothetical protein